MEIEEAIMFLETENNFILRILLLHINNRNGGCTKEAASQKNLDSKPD